MPRTARDVKIVDGRLRAGAQEYRVRKARGGIQDDEWWPQAKCDPKVVEQFESWAGKPQPRATRPTAPPPDADDTGRRRARAAAADASQPVVAELEMESVPEYFPTAEQFKDPLAYIQQIYDQAELYGVVIINPPEEAWEISVKRDQFSDTPFAVKKQKLLKAQREGGDPVRARDTMKYITSTHTM
jgi:hypothetical protein